MSRVKEGANAAVKWYEEHGCKDGDATIALVQSKRVLLLGKAYRYQRAAFLMAWHARFYVRTPSKYNDGPIADALVSKSGEHADKAAELYKQAEEI